MLITFPDKTDVFLSGDDVTQFWQHMPKECEKKYYDNGCRLRLNIKSHAAWCLSDYKLISDPIDKDFYDRMGLTY
jgi:hypothetical protein